MIKINDILKKHDLRASRYEKRGKVTIIDTDRGKYVCKNGIIDNSIFDYLKSRNFNYMPDILENDEYQMARYIDGFDIPSEQKIVDLIKLVALLHSKTTHYKEVDKDYYEEIYSDLDNNINYLYGYYSDLISIIETKVYPSPSQQIISRNISKIYSVISSCKKRLDNWHSLIDSKEKTRNVVVHNNLKLSHFIRNEKSYLVSWDKAKIDSPIFDIYKLYQNHVLDFDFGELFKIYNSVYPLTDDEKELFFVLISLPDIIDLNGSEYEKCMRVSHTLDKIYKTEKFLLPETFKDAKKV